MNLFFNFWFIWRIFQKGLKLLLYFWSFSRILDQKGVNLLPDFWIFSDVESRKEGTSCLIWLLVIFSNLWPERSKIIARSLAIFSNLSPERSETFARFLAIFTMRPGRRKCFAPFLLFCRIWGQIGVNSFSVFGYFKEFGMELLFNFWLFWRIWDQRRVNLFLNFWLFSCIFDQKRVNLLDKLWPLSNLTSF